jgi:hypothetical protein
MDVVARAAPGCSCRAAGVDVLLVQEAGIGAAAAGLLVLLLPLQACRHRCGGSNVVMDATDRSSSVQLGLLAFGRRERSAARNTAGSWAVGGRRMACEKRPCLLMAGPGNNPAQGFPTWLLQYCITIGSEATFLSALCVIRCPSNLVWSRTFLLGVSSADLGHFGRYFGQNKEIVSVFYGSVVYFNVGLGLFLGRSCGTRQAPSTLLPAVFLKHFAVETVEILCPEVNVRPPHKNQNISRFRFTP